MQTMALGLSFFASRLANNLDFAGWGREFTGTMEAYQCIAGMYLIGEDMSQETNPQERDRKTGERQSPGPRC